MAESYYLWWYILYTRNCEHEINPAKSGMLSKRSIGPAYYYTVSPIHLSFEQDELSLRPNKVRYVV